MPAGPAYHRTRDFRPSIGAVPPLIDDFFQELRGEDYTPGVSRSPSTRPLSFVLCIAAPLSIAILMNALVRPALAERLGGERRQSMTTAKSQDGWWAFDAATRDAHPALTAFLEFSDGALAVSMLAVAAVAAIAYLLRDRRRERSRTL
ncbi:hypothetical protein [Leucobacter sp. gxy201]|uniref:hypothetical protein n=1 Tax=Leucobacter sp. gxy201 TaxID=2957200 RepID=UPI003DA0E667